MATIKDPQTALYEKMATEQRQYKKWLLEQPPDEILNHAYEYSTREDIMVEMEELELTDAQAKALLKSPSPLADVYKTWQGTETHHMEDIRDVIENRADEAIKLAQERKKTDKER